MADAGPPKAINLARVRDNQRRSRARKKEYVQELETKLRNCEQTGVEATTEIQAAARKVLEENRKLRALLRERGVAESEITAILAGGNSTPENTPAAASLNTMLSQRRPCNGQTACAGRASCGPPISPVTVAGQQRGAPLLAHNPPAVAFTNPNDSPSPHSMASVETPPTFQQLPHHIPPSFDREASETDTITAFNYNLDPSFQTPWSFPIETNQPPEPDPYVNTSSCAYAAGLIRTIKADIGAELEADLGCQDGQDCMVQNTVVFNVMEKYANPT